MLPFNDHNQRHQESPEQEVHRMNEGYWTVVSPEVLEDCLILFLQVSHFSCVPVPTQEHEHQHRVENQNCERDEATYSLHDLARGGETYLVKTDHNANGHK